MGGVSLVSLRGGVGSWARVRMQCAEVIRPELFYFCRVNFQAGVFHSLVSGRLTFGRY